MSRTELLLASKRCNECLTTKNRIVPGARAAEIVKGCRDRGEHFQCHKGSLAGINLHCRGVHEISTSKAYRFAKAFNIPIEEIDPEALSQP